MTLKGEFFASIKNAWNERNGGDPSLTLGVTVILRMTKMLRVTVILRVEETLRVTEMLKLKDMLRSNVHH
ncbi:hypothetical protein TISLANDTSLP1_18570 [Thermodesulfovibrio yellowstonii]|jgi:hypothetical protein|uniref:Uncharacterized protein n=1 Tax=Thermodesulfovibrio yellowstonii TaxID=28262 RepID=A0A9W6GHT8_9BACT|nr:hypothetical protein TISLANDTSLP1_18570 [Thermodesulfovibrio islandicus]